MGSIHYGPYALVALSDGDYALKADLADIKSWLKLSPTGKREMRFTATGSDGKTMTLLPLNRVVDESYSVHLNISADATQCLCGTPDRCVANGGDGIAAGTSSLTWSSDTLIPTGAATISSFIRSGDPMDVSAVMMQGAFVVCVSPSLLPPPSLHPSSSSYIELHMTGCGAGKGDYHRRLTQLQLHCWLQQSPRKRLHDQCCVLPVGQRVP